MLRKVLVGVDGSEGSRRALRWAATLAASVDAELVAVHVLTFSEELRRDVVPLTTMTTWRRNLEAAIGGVWVADARASVPGLRTVVVEDDSAAMGLVQAAHRESADLLVVGAHGHGGLAGALGSTTYKVSHRANHPVVVVPPDWTA